MRRSIVKKPFYITKNERLLLLAFLLYSRFKLIDLFFFRQLDYLVKRLDVEDVLNVLLEDCFRRKSESEQHLALFEFDFGIGGESWCSFSFFSQVFRRRIRIVKRWPIKVDFRKFGSRLFKNRLEILFFFFLLGNWFSQIFLFKKHELLGFLPEFEIHFYFFLLVYWRVMLLIFLFFFLFDDKLTKIHETSILIRFYREWLFKSAWTNSFRSQFFC